MIYVFDIINQLGLWNNSNFGGIVYEKNDMIICLLKKDKEMNH